MDPQGALLASAPSLHIPEAGPVKLRITLPGAPRTKKTSNRIVRFKGRGRDGNMREFISIRPSEAYEEWLGNLLTYAPVINSQILKAAGPLGLMALPFVNKVSIACHVYQEVDRGDLLGYLNAVADAIQAPKYRQTKDGRYKTVREGLNIIEDDRQIVNWDDSHPYVDKDRPRSELIITVQGSFRVRPKQDRLLFEEEF